MEKYKSIRIKVSEEIFNEIKSISDTLQKKGWKQKEVLNIQDLLFLSLLKNFNSSFKSKFIEEQTPVDFLVQEALKEPLMRVKLNQFLKTNSKTNKLKTKKRSESNLKTMF